MTSILLVNETAHILLFWSTVAPFDIMAESYTDNILLMHSPDCKLCPRRWKLDASLKIALQHFEVSYYNAMTVSYVICACKTVVICHICF